MKFVSACVALLPLTSAFVVDSGRTAADLTRLDASAPRGLDAAVDRKDFIKTASAAATVVGLVGLGGEPAFATGRATLEQSYERYAPRIVAGGAFYQGDLKQMVASADWEGIKAATGNVPARQKEDLSVRYLVLFQCWLGKIPFFSHDLIENVRKPMLGSPHVLARLEPSLKTVS